MRVHIFLFFSYFFVLPFFCNFLLFHTISMTIIISVFYFLEDEMYFLIDYENVNYIGLEGTEFLEPTDTVSFFYSNCCENIIRYRMMDIEKSGCNFEICKLKTTRANALDFYIASKVGEIFTTDINSQIAIISNDKDHNAVMDYWKDRLPVQNQLVVSKTIAKGIQAVNGEGKRKKVVLQKLQILNLKTEFDKYSKRMNTQTLVEQLFTNSEYENLIPQITDFVLSESTPKTLYLNMLKSFGRSAGLEIYRKIKELSIE